ncbi:hypothetical protein [Botrimarina mediterranea]|uniref:SHOCT domain-containing protein n=1 Tax=Botrimarina mediterranea TaxID=2528022 RepID=A0A518KAZ8_9BACT|nr:hypothetical protein [Botrimarina mediterranea]QDV74959.1 hypothetical protein Spa11_31680 [Botrimarina mediterranea]QDV79604.1 hypothetical protein K2D_32190 [Planctomycetes bacterium K2D]
MSLPPLAVAIVWIAVILGMTAAFIVFVHKWRERRVQERESTASDLLSEFHEIRSRGELSAEEYQRIKERLNAEVQRELIEGDAKDSSDPARALKATARRLLSSHHAPTGEGETNGAVGGAAQDGCDAAPPSGGDSTEERR